MKRNYLLEDPGASGWTLLLDSRIQIPIGDRTSPFGPRLYEHTSCVLDLSYFKRRFYWTGERAFKSVEQKRRFDPTAMEFKVCINNVDGPFAVLAGRIVLPVGGGKKIFFFFFSFSQTANNQRSNQPRARICYISRV